MARARDHDVTEGTDGTVDGDEAFHELLDFNNQTVEVTFDQAFLDANPMPGNLYDYFCSPHFIFNMVGTVTVLETEPGSAYCDCTDGPASPCNNPGAAGGGCENSGGSGGILSASGSNSAGADDLVFEATQLLSGQPALLFVGTAALNNGDGLRCAGNNVIRLGVDVPDGGGVAQWGPGLGAQGGWGNGDVRRFQVWYRDPNNPDGSPCGNSFNLTNGYEVSFTN